MKRHFVRRLLALFLTLVMVFGVVPGREAKAEAISVWTPLADIDAAAASEKSVAVTMTTSAGATFVLPSANTSAAPAAKTGEISEGNLRAEGEESVYGWTVTALEGGGYTLQNAAGGYLYVTAANNGVRVGSLPTTGGEFSVTDGYLTASDSNGATRYIGVYNGQDFRCYTSNTGNIKDQTLQFWAYSETVEEDIPVVISTIAEALEGENGTKFTVKGVVTLVDGKNIYVQDATGGINLYFAAAPTDIALGDTLQAEGTRGAYSGVPQLAQAEAEKLTDPSELITLEAKEATLGGLSTDDLCTYVHIADLTVTAVSDTEINVKDADEATGLLYKPVLGDQTVKVGDGIDFTGAVGIYNSKFQLRNTEASEIKVTAGEDPIDPPVGDEIDKLTEPLTDGTFVVIYHPTSGMALTATASGSKLAGVTAAVADGKLTKTDDMAYMTVVESEGALAFELGGKYLTSGATGNSLTFADELTDLGRWTQEKQDDGTWYLMNVGANYNGNHNQALEYYNGFTTYGRKENNDAYKFEIYGVEAAPSYGLLDAVTNGAKVVIYHPTSSMTMTATASGAKLAGVASEMAAPNRLAKLDDMAYMTVAKADGVVTFELNGQYLTSADTGNGLSFSDTLTDMGRWTLEKQDDGTWYVKNVGANYNGNHNQALEYYSGFTTYGFKTTDAYKFQFFGTPGEDEPIDPPDPGEEKEYGLVKTLAEGDLVIIYNRASGKGVSSEMIGSYYLAGVDLTDEENVIKTSNEDVIWTVHVNEDGTNTFTQGPVTFGGVQTTNASTGRVYNNINLSEPTATLWTREDTANEGEYYLYLGELPSSKTGGHIYLDWYANYSEFSLNDYANPGTNSAYMFSFYKQDAEPEIEPGDLGDLVTDLSKLTDGTTVSIYSPGHHTAISSKPNGDWYLKANTANIVDGKVTDFTSDFVWTVKVNENGTYSFYSYDDPTKSITVWPSGNYAELSLNVETYPDNTWTLTPAATKNCFYFSSPTVSGTRGPAYIEAYVRNEFEVFSGYFTSPSQSNFKDSDFALQFYLVNPEDAVATHDDGEWDGVLTPGKQYVAHNVAADSSIGLFDPANYSMKAIPTTFDGGKAIPDNGAYVWTVGSMGRYYSFQMNGKYLASNNEEELFLIDPNEDGTVPENAKWFLVAKEGGYIIYNKDASYNGTPVCIEYFSSVFSGWTYNTKNELAIYLFNFYELADGVKVYHDVVQNPTVKFECEDSRYVEQDYALAFTLDDLAPEITDIAISFTAGSQTVPVTEYESSEDGKAYNCVIPASQIDVEEGMESFTIKVVVNNSYEIEYEGLKTVTIIDEPFFENLKPAPNAQTMDDKRPLISAKIGNVGENPTFTMTLTTGEGDNKQTVTVDPVYGIDTLVYTPLEDMADGRVTVHILVERADGVTAEKSWSFTVGKAGYQLYFGQLHSHTTYSDGSGSLETALDYVASLPESANVDFVAFTDHSNYFDTTSAANPADSLNDKSLMTEASLALWNKYKNTVASFNASHTDLLAIAGFEMTWSGGPGHINTFDSDGLVSRNNAPLNNKTNDAGMKLYYETINKGESLNQFNHPGNTFGNFTDFSYWDETTDDHMFLVEVGNGEGQIGAGGYYPSYEQYILALDQGWHLAPTNNQDNHKGRWGNANDARDVVLTNDFSEQGIYDAIRALRVYATEDKNLQVTYVVNDQPMGTIFGEDEKPAELKVEVTVYEPDEKESIQKVEIVADGGKVVQTWDSAAELAEGYVTATLTPDQTYYFARVTEADGDLAVTAPVWVGSGVSAGITEVKSSVDPAIVNEATTLTTTFFSNEETDGTIKSIVYTVDGSKVVGTDTTGYTLTKDGLDVTFSYTPDVAKRVTITVTAVIEFNGKEKTYTKDLILSVRETGGELPVTPIATVMKQTEEGFEYAIEGVVTSNASGYDKDTAFFDCIYVQDETGGICCFPVSGEYKIGDKVHIEGYTDWYQGEPELQVTKIDVIGSGEVEPTVVTSAQINDLSVLGSLVTLKGTIENFEEVNGLIQTIMVKDENGDVARVFIDGYITTGAEVVGCVVGAAIEATGLSSYDDTWPDTNYFARIRIRNRADIICGSAKADVARVYGNTRYKTSIAVAQELKERLGVEKFDTILICTGENPVDALAGSYLSVKMMAPILMVQNKKTPIKLVTDYVRDNLAEGGKVYVFGGENAVPDACLEGIRELGIEPERLAGSTRFRTNMLINETIGIEEGAEVLICDGQGEKDENGVEQYAFADSLSASASGRPLFLVDGSASAPKNYQKEYLKELAEKGCTFVILGGEKAVSPEMKASIEEIVGKEVERIAGSTRYRTSAALAERFFPDAKGIVLATGVNFPDGLAGGALAAALGAPIFLCSESKAAVNLAKDFVEAHQITTGVVLGGPAEGKDLITDANACLIFGLESAEEIHVRFLE